ncbi:VOC family protein [Nocardia arthritidis]|uniref:VOC family protein n=1 Tax=Nocardia arthritidis TaxID=228602 RepID=A0A6G9Y4W4_9NOCA|nr:VOC family protein [Nocardia arthritidis]QIS08231.1 VOC family protein [Nocardia arthritidis]
MTLALGSITFDCADAAALADFWARLLNKSVDPDGNEHFATIGYGTGTTGLMFIQVPDKNPGKNVIHLDLQSADRQAEVQRAIALGAEHVGDFDEYGHRWTTLTDPEGNLFDIGEA